MTTVMEKKHKNSVTNIFKYDKRDFKIIRLKYKTHIDIYNRLTPTEWRSYCPSKVFPHFEPRQYGRCTNQIILGKLPEDPQAENLGCPTHVVRVRLESTGIQ